MPVRIVFWNCGGTPTRGTGKRRPSEVALVVDEALADGVDMVALCEVDTPFLDALKSEIQPRSWSSLAITEKVGQSRWDLGLFYRHDRVSCSRGEPTTARDRGSMIRAAHSVAVRPRDPNALEFVLYLLHWRSRLHGDGHHYRKAAAAALYQRVRRDLEHGSSAVVIGDFNDEPFDLPISAELHASRDPLLVTENPLSALYNPTWWLASPSRSDPWGGFGTASYPAGRTSRRYALDQALTSASFLNADKRTAPVATLFAASGIADMDHLPLELWLP